MKKQECSLHCKLYNVVMILKLLKEDRLFFASRLCQKVECRSSSFIYVPKSVRHFCGHNMHVVNITFVSYCIHSNKYGVVLSVEHILQSVTFTIIHTGKHIITYFGLKQNSIPTQCNTENRFYSVLCMY